MSNPFRLLNVVFLSRPTALVWTTLRKDRDDPRIQKLIGIYRSPEVQAYIPEHFNGSIIPAW